MIKFGSLGDYELALRGMLGIFNVIFKKMQDK